jgi:UDPglucose 6-dehydrogenase
MDVRSAELTEYAANALLATKILFMNELANLTERLGADIECVRIGICSNPRIGFQFIWPGCGYGGSCFPKDVQALVRTAPAGRLRTRTAAGGEGLESVPEAASARPDQRSLRRRQRPGRSALHGVGSVVQSQHRRHARGPRPVQLHALWRDGASVAGYNPKATEEARRLYPAELADGRIVLCDTKEAAPEGADALEICKEWKRFIAPNFEQLGNALRQKLIFDGRNLYDPERLAEQGWTYFAIGRGASVQAVK